MWHRLWTGPYMIVKELSDVVNCLQHSQLRRKRPVVRFNRLKPYSPETRLPQVPSLQTPMALQKGGALKECECFVYVQYIYLGQSSIF